MNLVFLSFLVCVAFGKPGLDYDGLFESPIDLRQWRKKIYFSFASQTDAARARKVCHEWGGYPAAPETFEEQKMMAHIYRDRHG